MEPGKQIYLLRHGRIEQTEPRRFIGQRDLPLSPAGEAQALDMAGMLAAVRFSRIFSSPLTRALQTAAPIAARQRQPVTAIPGLAEISLGQWEGFSVEEVRLRFPGGYEERGRALASFRPPDGESFHDLALRAFPCFAGLVENHPGPLLIVAHAGINRVLLSRIQGLPLAGLLSIPQDYCCLNIIRWQGGRWQIDAVNQKGLNEKACLPR
jgi:probable phosphoglycerate mutase